MPQTFQPDQWVICKPLGIRAQIDNVVCSYQMGENKPHVIGYNLKRVEAPYVWQLSQLELTDGSNI